MVQTVGGHTLPILGSGKLIIRVTDGPWHSLSDTLYVPTTAYLLFSIDALRHTDGKRGP